MSTEGVDYAWQVPDPRLLYAAGKRFVVRYGGPGSDGKQLHPVEARALTAAGLAIVANAEGSAAGLAGRSVGVAWARSADEHFRSCGMPTDRPIYFSADFDVTAARWPGVAEALRGAASVIGPGRVGVYGSHDAVVWARRDRVAAWFWQTYAWSSHTVNGKSVVQWAPGNHLEQYRNGVTLAGATLDLDRALTVDYGQWPAPAIVAGNSKTPTQGEAMFLRATDGPSAGSIYLVEGGKVHGVSPSEWAKVSPQSFVSVPGSLITAISTPPALVDAAAVAAALAGNAGFITAIANAVGANVKDQFGPAFDQRLVDAANKAEDS